MDELVNELKQLEKTLAKANYSLEMLSSTLSWLGRREPPEKKQTACLPLAASVCVIIASIISIAVQLTR